MGGGLQKAPATALLSRAAFRYTSGYAYRIARVSRKGSFSLIKYGQSVRENWISLLCRRPEYKQIFHKNNNTQPLLERLI